MKHFFFLLLFCFSASHTPPAARFCTARKTADPAVPRPKNIILMIGDGMGLTQVTAAMYSNGGKPLQMETCPVTGLIKTHASNNLITDSAAGATAFACGCKTYNGAVAMDVKKKNCRTILEEAEANGLATGLVATSSIVHATPAAFVGHAPSRTNMEEIAAWFLKNEVDFVVGGGMKFFNERSDGRDLLKELAAKNYQIRSFLEEKLTATMLSDKQPFIWFSNRDQPESFKLGRDYLPLASSMAPQFLKKWSGGKGFFLMIEGSQIDWGGHANNAEQTISETLDFDRAVGEVLKFAEADGQTLVVVTADHETGGMAILNGSKEGALDIKFSTDYHTATLIPVFAYGPGAPLFSGVYDNTDIYWKMRELFGFPEVPSTQQSAKKN